MRAVTPALLLLLLLLLQSPLSARAAIPAPDGSADRNLRIDCHYAADDDTSVPIEGVLLEILRAADLSVSGGELIFTPQPAFADLDVDIRGMHASEQQELAAALSERMTVYGVNGVAVTTGADGIASCPISADGLYLVRQMAQSKDAVGYETIEPFLVLIPQPEEAANGTDAVWNYEVTAVPKSEIRKAGEPPEEPSVPGPVPEAPKTTTPVASAAPRTDDGSRFWEWACVLVISAEIAVLVWQRKRRDANPGDGQDASFAGQSGRNQESGG